MSITINNLFFSFDDQHGWPNYYYVVGNDTYYAHSQDQARYNNQQWTQIQSFTVNPHRSDIIVLTLKHGHSYAPMLYQWDFNENQLYELIPRPQDYQTIIHSDTLYIQDPNTQTWYDLDSADEIGSVLNNYVSYIRLDEDEEEEPELPPGFRHGSVDYDVVNEIDQRFPNGITNEVFDLILRQKLTLRIDNLYYAANDPSYRYFYLISGRYYNTNLLPLTPSGNLFHITDFNVDLTGSTPYILLFRNSQGRDYPVVYQVINGLTELTPRPPPGYNRLIDITEIRVPLNTPGGVFEYPHHEARNTLNSIRNLLDQERSDIFDHIIQITQSRLSNLSLTMPMPMAFTPNVLQPVLSTMNIPQPIPGIMNMISSIPREISHPRQEETSPSLLLNQSYETLIKQLYGFPVEIPPHLIINGLKVNFISFQQVDQMLQDNKIERYILDPLLQPWAGAPNQPNRILTIFGKNGITYLVKARYDKVTNQIFPHV